jgi:DNA-directed RNA polymerase subunit RPC12/RpoP
MIRTACSHCGRKIEAGDQYSGHTIACPKCEYPVVMPGEVRGPRPDSPTQMPRRERPNDARGWSVGDWLGIVFRVWLAVLVLGLIVGVPLALMMVAIHTGR